MERLTVRYKITCIHLHWCFLADLSSPRDMESRSADHFRPGMYWLGKHCMAPNPSLACTFRARMTRMSA